MKILVAIKRVVDHNVSIRLKSDHSGVDLDNAKMSINPFCEIAVEQAVRFKEQGMANEVVVVSVGTKASQEQLRTALALGADRAILVESEQSLSSLNIARILKSVVDKEQPQLILLGKQSIDSDNNQTGQMLAALCEYGQGTFASDISISEQSVQVSKEVDGGIQVVELNLPAVITTDLRLNEPRYATLPNIMKAKRKPLDIIPLSQVQHEPVTTLETLTTDYPPKRKAGIQMKSVDELIDKLKNDVRVI